MQVHVREESSSLKRNLLVHILVVVNLPLLFPSLTQLDINFVLLLLSQRQLLVDVRL